MPHSFRTLSVVSIASAALFVSACQQESASPEQAAAPVEPAQPTSPEGTGAAAIRFHDARAQTVEFMGYYESIPLTATQERVKEEALRPLPAPCCSEFSALTCCCECNLSRSVWGLSHYLITQGHGAEEVRRSVQQWLAFVNPDGHSGRACTSGRCGRPFAQDGCGGMNPSALVF